MLLYLIKVGFKYLHARLRVGILHYSPILFNVGINTYSYLVGFTLRLLAKLGRYLTIFFFNLNTSIYNAIMFIGSNYQIRTVTSAKFGTLPGVFSYIFLLICTIFFSKAATFVAAPVSILYWFHVVIVVCVLISTSIIMVNFGMYYFFFLNLEWFTFVGSFLLLFEALYQRKTVLNLIFLVLFCFTTTFLLTLKFGYVFLGFIIIILYVGSILILFLFFGILINNTTSVYTNKLYYIYNSKSLLVYYSLLILSFVSCFGVSANFVVFDINFYLRALVDWLSCYSTDLSVNYFVSSFNGVASFNDVVNGASGSPNSLKFGNYSILNIWGTFNLNIFGINVYSTRELDLIALNFFTPYYISVIHTSGLILLAILVSLIFCVNWTVFFSLFNTVLFL